MTFARWLSRQHDRADWIGDLSRAAKKDPHFPWTGEPLDVGARVRSSMSDANALHAFAAALDEWHGGPYPLSKDRTARDDACRTTQIAAFEASEAVVAERRRIDINAAAAFRRATVLASPGGDNF